MCRICKRVICECNSRVPPRMPTYDEDNAAYDDSRMKYLQQLAEHDPVLLSSQRKPTLDEQEGGDTD